MQLALAQLKGWPTASGLYIPEYQAAPLAIASMQTIAATLLKCYSSLLNLDSIIAQGSSLLKLIQCVWLEPWWQTMAKNLLC